MAEGGKGRARAPSEPSPGPARGAAPRAPRDTCVKMRRQQDHALILTEISPPEAPARTGRTAPGTTRHRPRGSAPNCAARGARPNPRRPQGREGREPLPRHEAVHDARSLRRPPSGAPPPHRAGGRAGHPGARPPDRRAGRRPARAGPAGAPRAPREARAPARRRDPGRQRAAEPLQARRLSRRRADAGRLAGDAERPRLLLRPAERLGGLRPLAREERAADTSILTFDAARLLAAHLPRAEIAPINTGATVHVPARRGRATFAPLDGLDWERWRRSRSNARPDTVKEVAIRGGVPDAGTYLRDVRPA